VTPSVLWTWLRQQEPTRADAVLLVVAVPLFAALCSLVLQVGGAAVLPFAALLGVWSLRTAALHRGATGSDTGLHKAGDWAIWGSGLRDVCQGLGLRYATYQRWRVTALIVGGSIFAAGFLASF
jgi:hypothetical protein